MQRGAGKILLAPLKPVVCQPLLLEFAFRLPTLYIYGKLAPHIRSMKVPFYIQDANAILATISKSAAFDPSICLFPATVCYKDQVE